MSAPNASIYKLENVPLFEAIYGKGLISLGGLPAVDEMFSEVKLFGKNLLDIGSGIGGIDHYLAEKHSAHVTGLEVEAWMCAFAFASASPSLQNQLRFVTYNPDGSIPLASVSMDLVFSKGVLTNVADKKSLFHELARVLKPHGELCLVDWLVPSEHPRPKDFI